MERLHDDELNEYEGLGEHAHDVPQDGEKPAPPISNDPEELPGKKEPPAHKGFDTTAAPGTDDEHAAGGHDVGEDRDDPAPHEGTDTRAEHEDLGRSQPALHGGRREGSQAGQRVRLPRHPEVRQRRQARRRGTRLGGWRSEVGGRRRGAERRRSDVGGRIDRRPSTIDDSTGHSTIDRRPSTIDHRPSSPLPSREAYALEGPGVRSVEPLRLLHEEAAVVVRAQEAPVLPSIGAGFVMPSPAASQAQVAPSAPRPNRKRDDAGLHVRLQVLRRSGRRAATRRGCPDSGPSVLFSARIFVLPERDLPHDDPRLRPAREVAEEARQCGAKSPASNQLAPPSPYWSCLKPASRSLNSANETSKCVPSEA